jgi:hypothetical protein
MKFLCLIHIDEQALGMMPTGEMDALNALHVAFNKNIHADGHFVAAEALASSQMTHCVRVRHGKKSVTDGPFAETKEMVAGFYLIEAGSMDEATEIASRIPSASIGTIEVRPTRFLVVEGKEIDAGNPGTL